MQMHLDQSQRLAMPIRIILILGRPPRFHQIRGPRLEGQTALDLRGDIQKLLVRSARRRLP